MLDNNLANRLKELRSIFKYKQDELADKLGISRQNYSHYETGRNSVPADVLIRLARIYHMSMDSLLGFELDDPSYVNDNDLSLVYEPNDTKEFHTYLEKNKKRFQLLTIDEKNLLFLFSKLNVHSKQEALEILNVIAKQRNNKY